MIGVLAVCCPQEFLIVRNYSLDFERRLKISRTFHIIYHSACGCVDGRRGRDIASMRNEKASWGGTGSAAYLQ